MSVQYASATGTGKFGDNPVTLVSGSVAPGQYYLVQFSGGSNGVPLPAPDATGTTAISATAGKVALVTSTTGLACNGGSSPCSTDQLAQIKDLVGYGGANFFEGAAAPTLSNTTAAVRLVGGCTETDSNAADFTAVAPSPRNTSSPLNPCSGPDAAPIVASTVPTQGASDFPVGGSLTVTFSEPVNVTAPWFTLSCSASGTAATAVSGGPVTFSLDPLVDLVDGEACTLTVLAAQVSDQDTNDPPDTMAANHTVGFTAFGGTTEPPVTPTEPPVTPTEPPVVVKQVQTARKPPKRIKKRGVTVLTKKNTRTNAGVRIKTKVAGKAKKGKVRYFRVIKGPKGKVSVRTFGRKRWRLVLTRSAPATDRFEAYRARTVYVNGKRR